MLESIGIHSTWVLVDTRRGFVDPKIPSTDGNHAIAAIEIPASYTNPVLQSVVTAKSGKRYLIFDPTNQYVPIGLLPTYLQGSEGVLMAGTDSQVIALPVLRPDNDTVERAAKFELAADGSLKGSITVSRLGASSDDLRHFFAMSSEKEMRESLEKSLRHDFSQFQLTDENVQNVRDLDKQLIMHYDVSVSSYAKSAGPLLLIRPRVLGTDATPLRDEARKYPIQFEAIGDWRDTFELQIPSGYAVDELPDPVNVDAGFASYHSEVKTEGQTLRYSREYIVKKLDIDADQYAALCKFEAEINTDENRSAVLKKQ
jgi:hypothetical protein